MNKVIKTQKIQVETINLSTEELEKSKSSQTVSIERLKDGSTWCMVNHFGYEDIGLSLENLKKLKNLISKTIKEYEK